MKAVYRDHPLQTHLLLVVETSNFWTKGGSPASHWLSSALIIVGCTLFGFVEAPEFSGLSPSLDQGVWDRFSTGREAFNMQRLLAAFSLWGLGRWLPCPASQGRNDLLSHCASLTPISRLPLQKCLPAPPASDAQLLPQSLAEVSRGRGTGGTTWLACCLAFATFPGVNTPLGWFQTPHLMSLKVGLGRDTCDWLSEPL